MFPVVDFFDSLSWFCTPFNFLYDMTLVLFSALVESNMVSPLMLEEDQAAIGANEKSGRHQRNMDQCLCGGNPIRLQYC